MPLCASSTYFITLLATLDAQTNKSNNAQMLTQSFKTFSIDFLHVIHPEHFTHSRHTRGWPGLTNSCYQSLVRQQQLILYTYNPPSSVSNSSCYTRMQPPVFMRKPLLSHDIHPQPPQFPQSPLSAAAHVSSCRACKAPSLCTSPSSHSTCITCHHLRHRRPHHPCHLRPFLRPS